MRLFIVEPLGAGGMIHYIYQLCTALADQGADVTLVTAQDYELEHFPHNFKVERKLRLWTLFDPSSAEIQRGPLARLWRKVHWTGRRVLRGGRLIVEWVRLTNYLLKQQPDLVQFGKINFPFEALFLARLRRRGLVLTQICHEFELRERSDSFLTQLANRLYTSVYDNFSAIFFLAESSRQRFMSLFSVPSAQIQLIPFGNESIFLSAAASVGPAVDLRQRYGLAADEPVVLFFGTLTPSKGLPDLLRAFAMVRQQGRPARLLIAGYPTKHIDMNELLALTTDLGIREAVTFDPRYIPFEEVGLLMELATVAVYPYRNSTQSAAMQTAYTFGRPVIATQVGGLPEAVDEGRSGFTVPPEAPEALAAAILKVIDDPDLAQQMGQHARHLSETRHSWQPIAEQILTVYRPLASQKQTAQGSGGSSGKKGVLQKFAPALLLWLALFTVGLTLFFLFSKSHNYRRAT
jgi:glycosyltransferase involved in cell wall biosynthesis